MGRNHSKRLAVPKAWALPRKTTTYIIRPAPGGHPITRALPLAVLLRDVLGIVKTAREVRYVLQQRDILVDSKRRRVADFPVGLMDVVALPQTGQYFRILITPKGTVGAIPIPEAEQHRKLCRITGKTVLNAKRMQLALSDGRTITADTKTQHRVGDSVLLELPGQKITEHYPLAVGACAYMVGGRHCGSVGAIERIEGNMINIKVGDTEFQTPKQYVFIVGKEKPAVTMA